MYAVGSIVWDLRSRETIFSKIGYLRSDKGFWPIFSRIIECDTAHCGNYKIKFLGPKRLMKKRQTFQYKKDFGHFSSFLEDDKCQVPNYNGQEDVLTVFVEVIRSAFKT